ncbi:MAG: DUF1015 domain-containing protein [Desulfarculaceae bacterium]|nr:DUF1015 domain-containing protein [Desulfarculaceae bacterium]MCF8071214.1 DUF1015 domain-containing protein [Desulfarculaceae bacterium]MCF8101183.1 DUF1015 domain-containing protein [Desulfarculaceae bacterium]MCF8115268.1 DUF1015 domain-containing protein [Desulfarculaceae bacterium]
MPVVAPFRALRYNPAKVPSLTQVVTPPYDVINSAQQESYYAADPHNIIRVELNKKRDSDKEGDTRYSRSAEHFQAWQEQGVLLREETPCFYLSETAYIDSEGNQRVRRGFFTLLQVTDTHERKVLPHEKTFTAHKEDRFQLTKAVEANISPIFALYPDDLNEVMNTLDQAREPEPVNDFVDPMGLPQRLYRVSDPEACRRVKEMMADKVIFIADGHHRYETAINYRNYMNQEHPEAGPDAIWNYTLTYLCSMSDPGLTVFACHRLVPRLDGFGAEDFLALAEPYFEVRELPLNGEVKDDKSRIIESLAELDGKNNSLGLISHDTDKVYLLTLKPGVMEQESGPDVQGPLSGLDVVVLTHLILDKILGLDNSARDQEHTIHYLADMDHVLREVKTGKAHLAFLLNPTKVSQVQDVAEAGLIMPRKATYFYPKVLTGLVINPLFPGEKAEDCRS